MRPVQNYVGELMSSGAFDPDSALQEWEGKAGMVISDFSNPDKIGGMRSGARYQHLNYGAHIEQMLEQKTGLFTVELGESTGAVIAGEYFNTLKKNKGMSLSFRQEGLDITFDGKDVKRDIEDSSMLSLEYTPGSLREEDIITASGVTGGESFAYSFKMPGDLPGTASFGVATNISEGEKVNVYQFNEVTGEFTLLADNLTVGVGGVVNYRSGNTMPHYLITTNTIEGALMPDSGANHWPITIGIISVLVLLAAGTVVFIVLRKKKQSLNPQSV
jgi:hypothetical protein